MLQWHSAIQAGPENHAKASWLQQVLSSVTGEGIDQARIPRGPQKRVGRDQRSDAHARHHPELWPRARTREAGDGAGTKRTGRAAAREREDVEGLLGVQSAQPLGHRRR